MHPLVRTPAVRRLNFDSPKRQPAQSSQPATPDCEADPNFPKAWEIDGVDIDARINKLRDELIERGSVALSTPTKDPKSKFRTEYRKILTAQNIVNEALTLHNKEIEWVKNATEMSSFDIESLQSRRIYLEQTVGRLRDQLTRLDVGILKSTQLAVKSVIELREDEYIDDDESDMNLSDQFQKFNKISKLCDVALKSYVVVKKRNEQLQKDLIVLRNKQRKHQEAMRNLMGETDRRRIDEGAKTFRNLSLEQLRQLQGELEKLRAPK